MKTIEALNKRAVRGALGVALKHAKELREQTSRDYIKKDITHREFVVENAYYGGQIAILHDLFKLIEYGEDRTIMFSKKTTKTFFYDREKFEELYGQTEEKDFEDFEKESFVD